MKLPVEFEFLEAIQDVISSNLGKPDASPKKSLKGPSSPSKNAVWPEDTSRSLDLSEITRGGTPDANRRTPSTRTHLSQDVEQSPVSRLKLSTSGVRDTSSSDAGSPLKRFGRRKLTTTSFTKILPMTISFEESSPQTLLTSPDKKGNGSPPDNIPSQKEREEIDFIELPPSANSADLSPIGTIYSKDQISTSLERKI